MNKPIDFFLRERTLRFRLFIEGLAVGAFVGIVVGLFRYLIEASEVVRPLVYDMVRNSDDNFVFVLYISSFVLTAFVLRYVVEKEPYCTGSGVPQLKGVLSGYMKIPNWWRVIWCKILGGVMAIGVGMSLGRAGPSVHLGALCGQGISKSRHRTRTEERILMTAGSGAGLAAAFNAPLAGVIFSLEEISKNFSPVVLTAAIGASVTSTTVSWLIFGDSSVFNIENLSIMPLATFGILVLLGLFVGGVALAFNPCLLLSLDWYERSQLKGVNKYGPALLLAAILGFILSDILGGGGQLVNSLLYNPQPLTLLWILFIGKFIYTMICFGTGAPGGIFMPMLVLGASSGAIFGTCVTGIGVLPAEFMPNMIVYGMAAYLSAVGKTPVTGSVLIMELTGTFHHILPLIIVSMTAYMMSDMTAGKPVYEQLLHRSIMKMNKNVK